MTIIEILVVVGITGILLSLLLPALNTIQLRSKDLKSLSNMRTHSQILTLYSGDYRDLLPYITDPNADLSIIRGGGQVLAAVFFDATELWFVGLTDNYYDSSLDKNLFSYPDIYTGRIYQYSSTLYTRPGFWNERTRSGKSQWRPVHLSKTRFPSSKASFTEFRTSQNSPPLPIWTQQGIRGNNFGFGFLDGSARRPDTQSLVHPFQTGDGGGPQSRYGEIGVVGVHTVEGIYGRDVQ